MQASMSGPQVERSASLSSPSAWPRRRSRRCARDAFFKRRQGGRPKPGDDVVGPWRWLEEGRLVLTGISACVEAFKDVGGGVVTEAVRKCFAASGPVAAVRQWVWVFETSLDARWLREELVGDATVLVEDGHVDVMAGQLHETEVAKRGDQLLGVTVRLQINDRDHSEMLVRS